MRLADVLVFDLTIVSDGLAWELAEASRLRCATDIILVCQATAMASELTPLLARVQEAMTKLPGDQARWLDELLPPLVYATSLANVGFVVALNRRLKNFNRRQLMPQRQNLQGVLVPGSAERKRVGQNDPKNGQHDHLSLVGNPSQSIISRPDRISATHTWVIAASQS
jgi:hypothetical protein